MVILLAHARDNVLTVAVTNLLVPVKTIRVQHTVVLNVPIRLLVDIVIVIVLVVLIVLLKQVVLVIITAPLLVKVMLLVIIVFQKQLVAVMVIVLHRYFTVREQMMDVLLLWVHVVLFVSALEYVVIVVL